MERLETCNVGGGIGLVCEERQVDQFLGPTVYQPRQFMPLIWWSYQLGILMEGTVPFKVEVVVAKVVAKRRKKVTVALPPPQPRLMMVSQFSCLWQLVVVQ